MAYDTGTMRSLLCVLGAWSCLMAQAPAPSAPADRAHRLMEEAGKLADQRIGRAMEQAIVEYRQAAPLWHELHERHRKPRRWNRSACCLSGSETFRLRSKT